MKKGIWLFFLTFQVYAVSWIDLPIADYQEITLIHDDYMICLNHKIKAYHAIPKTQFETLNIRANALHDIHASIEQNVLALQNAKHKSLLQHFSQIAYHKALYLEAIAKLYEAKDDEGWHQVFLDYPVKGNTKTRAMTDGLMYCISQDGLIGHFWLEVIDPCHRVLVNHYEQWRGLQGPKPAFFLWLEDQYVSLKTNQVEYPSHEMLAQYFQVEKSDVLYWHDPSSTSKKIMDSKSYGTDEFIFVITKEGQLKAAPKKSTFRHSSLTMGEPVLGVGNFEVIDGKIKSIFLNSGHYLPSWQEYRQTIEWLLKHDYVSDKQMPVKYYDSTDLVQTTFEDFLHLLKTKP